MAHNFNLNEPVIKALATQLAAQMPTTVTAVNADVSDGYTILPPVRVYDHMPLLSTIAGAGFPAVAIEDMPSQIEDDLVSSATGAHCLAVVVFVANPDPEALAWQLRRSIQAVFLAIQADRTYGGVAWTTTFVGVDPGPMLAPGDKPNSQGDSQYVTWAAVEIECRREEV